MLSVWPSLRFCHLVELILGCKLDFRQDRWFEAHSHSSELVLLSQYCTGLDNRGQWFSHPVWPIFFLINDSHCDRIHSCVTAVHYFSNSYMGKAASGFERILFRVLQQELQENMDGVTGCLNITKTIL